MNSRSTCFSEYLRTQLKHRNFEVIAVETRRNGLEGLTPRADLHCSEIAREQRLLSLTVNTGKFCCVAIDPDTGLFGAYQIFQPNGELDFEGSTGETAPTSAEAIANADRQSGKLRKAGNAAYALAKGIVAAEIKDYESMLDHIPEEVDPELTLIHLRHAKNKLMEVETRDGSFASGGYEQLRDTLPCRQRYSIVAEVCKTETGTKHDPCITFVPSQDQPDGCKLPTMFRNQTSIQADIATSDKRAALKFIHFALYQDINVKLELELEYAIASGRWSVKVVNILDSKDVINNAKSAQLVFKDF